MARRRKLPIKPRGPDEPPGGGGPRDFDPEGEAPTQTPGATESTMTIPLGVVLGIGAVVILIPILLSER